MSIFTKIAAAFKNIWLKLSGALKKAIPEAIVVVTFFNNLLKNVTVDAILEGVSKGVITPAIIQTVNNILSKILEKLHDAEALLQLAENEKLIAYATTFNTLNDTQKSAFLTQLATEIVKTKIGADAVNSEITGIIQLKYAESIA